MTDNSRLKSYIDRIEELATEKAAINDGIRDIFTEVKSAGYDPKAVRAIIRERAQDQGKVKELAETVDLYKRELGILADLPLGRAAVAKVAENVTG